VITSPPSATATATLTTTDWWAINPLAPTTDANDLIVTAHNTTVSEQSTPQYAQGVPLPSVLADVVGGRDGTMTVETFTGAAFLNVERMGTSQAVYWLTSPFGFSAYVRLGIAPGGMSMGGQPNPTRASKLHKSSAANPHYTTTLQYVAVGRP
jgi:hypothetical protein